MDATGDTAPGGIADELVGGIGDAGGGAVGESRALTGDTPTEVTGERPHRDRGERGFRDDRGFRPDRGRGDRERDRDRGDRGYRDDRGPRGDRGFRGDRDRGPAGGYRRDQEQPEEAGISTAPVLPEGINPRDLAPEVRDELRSLSSSVADSVARHLVATGQLLDDAPEAALAHARAARQLAPRIAAVREALGLASYHNAEWQSAIAELRTYHRITGRQTHLAVIADSERALGRPERAIDIYRTADRSKLAPEEAVELLIVAAGARGDLGQRDAAVAMLQVRELTADSREPWVVRLRYAYAESLLAAGRREEAREWFARAAEIDEELATDAAERLLELDGVVLEDAVDAEYDEDEDDLYADEAEEEEEATLADRDEDLEDEDELDEEESVRLRDGDLDEEDELDEAEELDAGDELGEGRGEGELAGAPRGDADRDSAGEEFDAMAAHDAELARKAAEADRADADRDPADAGRSPADNAQRDRPEDDRR